MRSLILFSFFLLFTPLLSASQSKEATEQEIRSLLESRDDEIKDLLGLSDTEYTSEQRDQLRRMINDIIDFESMASYALGNTFDEIDEDRRREFISLFSSIVRDQSLNRLEIYRAEVSYDNIDAEGDNAWVETTVRMENVRTPVSYRMERTNSGWLITDMSIDNVSTAESYHRQFQSIIRQRGFDALLESLRRRAART